MQTHYPDRISYQQKPVTCSNCTCLRYLQRVEGLDLDSVRKKVLTDRFKEMWDQLANDGSFPILGKAMVRV